MLAVLQHAARTYGKIEQSKTIKEGTFMNQPIDQRGSAAGVTLAVIAIIISIVALVLAWMAYNRTGADLEERIQQQISETTQEVQPELEQGAQEVEQGARDGAQQLDEGFDGVDEDDTDTTQDQNQSSDDSTQTTPQ